MVQSTDIFYNKANHLIQIRPLILSSFKRSKNYIWKYTTELFILH